MMALFNDEYIQNAYGREKFNEGRAEGRAEGAGLMAKLALLLMRDGRADELVRAGSDESFRSQLYAEYQLA